MKCQTFGLNGRLSKIPQLQPKPLVGSSLVRHRTDEVFYLSIIISGIHPFYDHLSRHLARPNSATNELFFSLRTETLRLFRVANSDLTSTYRIIASGILRSRSSTPRLRYTGSRSKDSIGRPDPHLYYSRTPSRLDELLGRISAF